jgi:REP element-mobilizing transposase RayT
MNLFGVIREDKSVLNEIGEIVRKCWIEIPSHFFPVEIETFVVMPNHLHGILIIHPSLRGQEIQDKSKERPVESFGKPVAGSIPTIIRSFKAAVTKRVHEAGLMQRRPLWQRGYYQHVLRNSREFINAKDYIVKNPVRWAMDKENPEYQPRP